MVKKSLRITLNIALFVLLIEVVYAWMVTTASSGEIVSYHRDLVVSNVDIDVTLYEMIKEQYYEVTDNPLELNYMAPNEYRYFKFTAVNNGDSRSTARIVIGGFSGDMNILQDKIYFGVQNSPEGMLKLSDYIEYNAASDYYYLTLTDDIVIDGYETEEIVWYIYIDKMASNEIAGAALSISSINFIKP